MLPTSGFVHCDKCHREGYTEEIRGPGGWPLAICLPGGWFVIPGSEDGRALFACSDTCAADLIN